MLGTVFFHNKYLGEIPMDSPSTGAKVKSTIPYEECW